MGREKEGFEWGERERGVIWVIERGVSGVREREGCEWSEIGGVSEVVERSVSGERGVSGVRERGVSGVREGC